MDDNDERLVAQALKDTVLSIPELASTTLTECIGTDAAHFIVEDGGSRYLVLVIDLTE